MAEAQSPPQKSLIIVFKLVDTQGSKIEGLSVWFWPAQEAADWIARRHELFPGASPQEIIALALLPEAPKQEIFEVLCGLPQESSEPDWAVLDEPRFKSISESCTVCVVKGVVTGRASAAKKVEKAIELFAVRATRAFPGVMRDETGLAKELALTDLEHGLRAAYDRSLLVAEVEAKSKGSLKGSEAPQSKRSRGL